MLCFEGTKFHIECGEIYVGCTPVESVLKENLPRNLASTYPDMFSSENAIPGNRGISYVHLGILSVYVGFPRIKSFSTTVASGSPFEFVKSFIPSCPLVGVIR